MAETASHPLPPTPPPPIYSPPARTDSPRIVEPLGGRVDGHATAGNQYASQSNVHIHPPETAMSRTSDPAGPNRTLAPQPSMQQDPNRLSPTPQAMLRQRPIDGQLQNNIGGDHRRVSSENYTPKDGVELTPFQKRSVRHASTSAIDSEASPESFEPLRYHHQFVEDAEMRALDKRASKLTIITDGSGGDSARNSAYGRNMQRPDSG